MRLGSKLFVALAVAAVLPLGVLGAMAFETARGSVTEEIERTHQKVAASEAEFVAAWLASATAQLRSGLSYTTFEGRSPAETQDVLNRVYLQQDRFALVALFDARGEFGAGVWVDDPASFARQSPLYLRHDRVSFEAYEEFQRRARESVQKVLALDDPRPATISAPYRPKDRDKPAVVIAVAAQQGSARWALAAEVTLDDLLSRVRDFRLGDSGALFVLDAQGRAVLHKEPSRTGADLSALVPPAVGATTVGAATLANGLFAAWAPVEPLGWSAVVTRERAEALTRAEALKRSVALAAVAALAVALALALLLSSSLARPIQALARGALEFASGRLSYRISLARKDELGDLASTFNSMGEQLDVSRQALEKANARLQTFNDELQAEVEKKTREVRELQAQVMQRQKLTAMGDLSAGLAHEINNPLCAVLGNTQLLMLSHPPGDPDHALLQDLETSAARIKELVLGMLKLKETEASGARARADLNQVVEAALQPFAGSFAEQKVDVVRALGKVPPVAGDAQLLEQVFHHLFSNARNAMLPRGGGTLTVATSPLDGHLVRVEVKDTGKGIAPEHLERIFDPFFTTKDVWDSKGLGLTVSHRIVESHGGRIRVASEPGKGTVFTLTFPAAPDDAQLV